MPRVQKNVDEKRAVLFRHHGCSASTLFTIHHLLDSVVVFAGIADRLTHDSAAAAASGVAAIVGHVYPIWLRFHGGKGAATGCGVFAVLTPVAIGPAVALFLITAWLTQYISLASVAATFVVPPLAWATGSPASSVRAAFAAAILIVFRHRSNLVRLRSGTERRFGVRA